MLSTNKPNPAREPLALLMQEYERKHGPIETTPLLIRNPPGHSDAQKHKRTRVMYHGKQHELVKLAKDKGMNIATVRARLRSGMSVEDAVDTHVVSRGGYERSG